MELKGPLTSNAFVTLIPYEHNKNINIMTDAKPTTNPLTSALTIALIQMYFFCDILKYINLENPVSFSIRYESEKIIAAIKGATKTRKLALVVLLILINISTASKSTFDSLIPYVGK